MKNYSPLIHANIKPNYTKKILLVCISFILVFFSVLAAAAQAADLYLSPPTGIYTIGSNFSINVAIDSKGVSINAAEGSLSFNTDELQVINISRDDSIFSLWTIEPNISNPAGGSAVIDFAGGTPKSFSGQDGNIITVNFKALKNAESRVNFLSGAILAADGKGTNVIEKIQGGVYTLKLNSVILQAEYVSLDGAPQEPNVYSSSHPDSLKWYANNNAKFSWVLSEDVAAVRSSLDKNPKSIPDETYSTKLSEKEFTHLEDGVWYFHIQFKNEAGWGKIGHFRFQIDKTKPEKFNIILRERTDPTEPTAKFVFEAFDAISGIDYYKIQIDGGEPFIWSDDGSHLYVSPLLAPGKHVLIAEVYDKAQNYFINAVDFYIEPLGAPLITDCPKELESGDILAVRGRVAAGAKAVVFLEKEREDARVQTVASDAEGNFIFVADEKLEEAVYKIWMETQDERGAKSNPTEKITIAVYKPKFVQIGSWVVNFLAVLIPLIALIVLLLLVVWYGWRKFSILRKKLKKEVGEAEKALQDAFDLLEKDARQQIKILEKASSGRELTKEENNIIEQLKKDLKETEKIVRKEIEDIEKI